MTQTFVWPRPVVYGETELAQTLLRVGNDAYADSNGSYGLTTLTGKQVGATADAPTWTVARPFPDLYSGSPEGLQPMSRS